MEVQSVIIYTIGDCDGDGDFDGVTFLRLRVGDMLGIV